MAKKETNDKARNLICDIEKETPKKDDWFYYGLKDNKDNIEEIFNKGIRSNILKDKDTVNEANYRYYVLLTQFVKDYSIDIPYIYNEWLKSCPMLILEKVKALKTSSLDYSKYEDSILPLRSSFMQATHQAFLQIPSKKIVGVELYLYGWLNRYKEQTISYYTFIDKILTYMITHDLDLPIYDFSRENDEIVHTLDVEQAKHICKYVLKK